jgi:hypothetical protein
MPFVADEAETQIANTSLSSASSLGVEWARQPTPAAGDRLK